VAPSEIFPSGIVGYFDLDDGKDIPLVTPIAIGVPGRWRGLWSV
jgi:hypothetical protein